MFHDFRQLAKLISILGLLTGMQACGPTPQGSKQSLVGGRPISSGETVPAVGLLFRYPDPVGNLYLTKTCTGVRVSETQIMTAASCLAGASSNSVQLTFLVAGDGSRAQSPVVSTITTHPSFEAFEGSNSPYNIALIRLENFPSSITSKVSVANLSKKTVNVGDAVKVYGAGCEKLKVNEKCDGAYTILRYLKTFDSVVETFDADTLNQKFFTTLQADGQSVDGDQGGPVLDKSGELVGLASYRKAKDSNDVDGQYSVYLNLADEEILSFLKNSISDRLPLRNVNFEAKLVESESGSFQPVGSYATIEVSDDLRNLDLYFSVNNYPIEDSRILKSNSRFTLPVELLEGRNTVSIVALDAEGTVIYEDAIDVYAGNRTVRLKVPELLNTAELDLRADLILNPAIEARGRGWFEGNDLVFKNVPLASAIVRVDIPTQGLSYTEFVKENLDMITLQGGRMQAVSANSNLDWANGLAGWNVKGGRAVRVLSGKKLRDGELSSVAVSSIRTSPQNQSIKQFSASSPSPIADPMRLLSDTPFVLRDEKNYLAISPDIEQTVEIAKTFKPSPGRKSLLLSFALRVRGLHDNTINPRALGEYTVQVRNAQGEISEYIGNMDSSVQISNANGLFFDQLEQIVSNTSGEVEVKIKMTTFSLAYGTPELIVSEVLEERIAVPVFNLDDGVDILFSSSTATLKNPKYPVEPNKTITVNTIIPLIIEPMKQISLGDCRGNCTFDDRLKGYHGLWGSIALKSAIGAKVEDMQLVVYDGTQEIGLGESYDEQAKLEYFKDIEAEGSLSPNSRLPLFRYPQTVVPRTSSAGTRIQLVLRVKTSSGIVLRSFKEKIQPLAWYQGTNAGVTIAKDKTFGGDRWGRVQNFPHLAKFAKFTVNDIANMHGGFFTPHKTHKDGRSVDLTHKNGNNDDQTVNDVVSLLQDEQMLKAVDFVYVTLKDASGLQKIQDRLKELVDQKTGDGRFLSPYIMKNGVLELDKTRGSQSVFRHCAGHTNHIHVNFY